MVKGDDKVPRKAGSECITWTQKISFQLCPALLHRIIVYLLNIEYIISIDRSYFSVNAFDEGEVRLKNSFLISAIILLLINYASSEIYGKLDPIY